MSVALLAAQWTNGRADAPEIAMTLVGRKHAALVLLTLAFGCAGRLTPGGSLQDAGDGDDGGSDGAPTGEGAYDAAVDHATPPDGCRDADPTAARLTVACAEKNCATAPQDDPSAKLDGGWRCLLGSCEAQVTSLQELAPECYDCLTGEWLAGGTFDEAYTYCDVQ